MGADFSLVHFHAAVAVLAVLTLASTVAIHVLAPRLDPGFRLRGSPTRMICVAAVAATLVIGVAMGVGIVGAMIDDEVNARPDNRYRLVEACWYLLVAGFDPSAGLTDPNPAPGLPFVGWLTWFAVGIMAAGVMHGWGWVRTRRAVAGRPAHIARSPGGG